MSEPEKPIHPRKIEIVHAAVTCFLERGYHQTGVRDIAKQAGVSLGNLYNHFKGKEAVLGFIAEIEGQELAGFIDHLSETTAPRATLERFIDDYATYVARPENALLGVEILTEAVRNPVIADVFGKNRNVLIAALVRCMVAGAQSGEFKTYDDNRAVACMILDTLESHGLRSLSEKDSTDIATHTLKTFLMNGLLA